MPLERISQGFRDISMSFQNNPLNSDLISLRYENAIVRAVKNIVYTLPGEKPFLPNFGSNVTRLLFENLDFITASQIEDEIKESVGNWEPRVKLLDVTASPDFENNAFDTVITYEIIGADVAARQLSLALQSTR